MTNLFNKTNKPGKYKIVTKKGKIITTFRLKMTAQAEKLKLEEEYMEDLEIEENE